MRYRRAVWLSPDTEETLVALAQMRQKCNRRNTRFASDCIETLEEIRLRAAEKFHTIGGINFSQVPCLNNSVGSAKLLTGLSDAQIIG